MAAASLLLPAVAAAQASPNVPISDPAYEDIVRLIREGTLDSVIVSHRPFSRGEFLRLARAASAAHERRRGAGHQGTAGVGKVGSDTVAGDDAIATIIDRLERRFGQEAPVAIDHVAMDGIAMSSAHRRVDDNGLGRIVTLLNPLAQGRQGRPVADGMTASAAVGVRMRAGRALAGAAGVRQSIVRPRGGAWKAVTEVEQLYLTAALGNVLVQAGRDHLALASGSSGLLVSGNAPALDLIKLTTARPFVMPWFLRHLGPTRITVFATDLGGGRTPDHDWLAGYRASILPREDLELGVTVGSQQGGSGSVRASPIERIVDLFPLVDVLFVQGRDLEISNKYSGIDFRWRLPHVHAMELYGDVLLDDFDHRRFIGTFRDDAAVIAGVTLPRLAADGAWQGSAEYQRTGLRFYAHGQFRHGLTRRDFILGNPLGPNAQAGRLLLRYAPDVSRDVSLELIQERRSGDRYIGIGGYGDETLRFVKVDTLPKEGRTRAIGRVTLPASREWTRIVAEAGVERVRNFGFTGGDDRTNGLARLGFEARF